MTCSTATQRSVLHRDSRGVLRAWTPGRPGDQYPESAGHSEFDTPGRGVACGKTRAVSLRQQPVRCAAHTVEAEQERRCQYLVLRDYVQRPDGGAHRHVAVLIHRGGAGYSLQRMESSRIDCEGQGWSRTA